MDSQKLNPVYLQLNNRLEIDQGYISVPSLFGLPPLSSNLNFNFEATYAPYSIVATGPVPTIDLITENITPFQQLSPLEVKLTALPDNSTANLPETLYGCEIVIRPVTIAYLGLSLALVYSGNEAALRAALNPVGNRITNWTDATQIHPRIGDMANALDTALLAELPRQLPLVMQPVWKTQGKKLVLADQCFDLFIWSNFALTRLFISGAYTARDISRPGRAIVWLMKMLYDFANTGRMAAAGTVNSLTYGPQSDKALSVNGLRTRAFMNSSELKQPRVSKLALRDIILGGGEKFLSPERRLDAAIVSTPGLFP